MTQREVLGQCACEFCGLSLFPGDVAYCEVDTESSDMIGTHVLYWYCEDCAEAV